MRHSGQRELLATVACAIQNAWKQCPFGQSAWTSSGRTSSWQTAQREAWSIITKGGRANPSNPYAKNKTRVQEQPASKMAAGMHLCIDTPERHQACPSLTAPVISIINTCQRQEEESRQSTYSSGRTSKTGREKRAEVRTHTIACAHNDINICLCLGNTRADSMHHDASAVTSHTARDAQTRILDHPKPAAHAVSASEARRVARLGDRQTKSSLTVAVGRHRRSATDRRHLFSSAKRETTSGKFRLRPSAQ